MTATLPASTGHARREGVRLGPIGLAWRPRVLVATLVVLAVACSLLVAGIAIGSVAVPVPDVLRVLLGGGSFTDRFIVLVARFPRAITGVLVGLSLGIAGALTQTFARNPLATPDILGVTSGASVGAVAAIVLSGGSFSVGAGALGVGIPVVATAGAVAAAALVYGLGWRGGVQSFRLILVGIGVAATLDAITSYLLVIAQINQATAASQWLVGSLDGTSWQAVWPLVAVCAVTIPIALACSSSLSVGQLGDDLATGVGLAVQRNRLLVIALAVLLTAAAVAAAGPVGFVAFVVPQIALRLAHTQRPPLLLSGLLGAALVLAADLLGRAVLPWDVPVGIITTVVGAPYFIWLLIRHRRDLAGS